MSSIRALQREEKGLIQIPLTVEEKDGRNYLLSFCTEDAPLVRIVLKERAQENWHSVSVGVQKRREANLNCVIICGDGIV